MISQYGRVKGLVSTLLIDLLIIVKLWIIFKSEIITSSLFSEPSAVQVLQCDLNCCKFK